ncbi:MAG: NAD(P)-dependent oxidoreductase [Bacteriovoracaceae bacterium]
MMKLLITGISGFLGFNLYSNMSNKFEIIGTHSKNILKIKNWCSVKLDLTNESDIQKLFNHYNPDLVIHAAAITKLNDCDQNPTLTNQVNVNSTKILAKLCGLNNRRFIFISTDLVFDGKSSGLYSETDATNPINLYAKSKVTSENFLLNMQDLDYTIMRMPLMFGDGGPYGKSSSYDLIEKLKKGENYSLFTNEFRTPLTGHEAAKAISYLLNCPEKIIHIGGPEKINRFDLGKMICNKFNFNINLLKPTSYHGTPLAQSRPENTSFNISLAQKYDYNPPSLLEQLNHF